MEYRNLGGSGLMVSEIGLGSNNFGTRIDEKSSTAIIRNALDAGINYIDTADWYGNRGGSEEIIGRAVAGKRNDVIIATKFGFAMGEGPNDRGGSRHHIMQAVEASLRRLNTDYIDVYQFHLPDPSTPIEETLRALDDLMHAGKVRYIGCSNFDAWQLCEALWTSSVENLASFVTVQCRYNILDRSIEHELVPCCKAYDVGVIPWGPLAGGFLSGKYYRAESAPAGTRLAAVPIYGNLWNEATFGKLDKLQAFARKNNRELSDLALAWLLAQPWISTVITGATSTEQITENIAATSWKLSEKEFAELSRITEEKNENLFTGH